MLANFFKSIMGGSASFKSASVAESKELINGKKVFLLDVRSREEFKQGHIKGAKNIPENELSGRLAEIEKHKSQAILVNCLSGGRSSSACSVLAKSGFTDVTNMSGGISAWMAARYPVAT